MKVAPWVTPVLVAPCLAVSLLVSARAAFSGEDPRTMWQNWVFGMTAGAALAFVSASAALLVDWLLRKWRFREVPTGRRAMVLNAAAPVLALAWFEVLPPAAFLFGLAFAVAFVVPIVGIALVLRLVFGTPFGQ